MRHLIFIISLIVLPLWSDAQTKLKVNCADCSKAQRLDIEKGLRELDPMDSLQIGKFLFRQGFWFHKITFQDSAKLAIDCGPKLQAGSFQIKFKDSLQGSDRPQFTSSNLTMDSSGISDYLYRWYHYYENQGHPFVRLSFDDYLVLDNKLEARMVIDPGPQIRFDSMVLKGYENVSEALLRYQLGYRANMLYREDYLQELSRRVNQLEFLSEAHPPAVGFFKDKTTLFLYLKENKANQIDGVIGLNTETDGRTTLNGDFQLRLLNAFERGEEIDLRWRRPDASVQELSLFLRWPFLFKSPFGLSGRFEIFRQDSSFVNTLLKGSLSYQISPGSELSLGLDYRSSNALSGSDSIELIINNFNTSKYSLGVNIDRRNRALVATKGYRLQAAALSGRRNTETGSQEQYSWLIAGEYFWNFLPNMVLKSRFESEFLFGEDLFDNELYRIGGLQTLRGFNEQSIFSSGYGLLSLEYRLMIGAVDYLCLFGDFAYSERESGGQLQTDLLTGLGTGVNFQTSNGIFSLFLAVGQTNDTPFDLRTTKVHLGYSNRF